MAGQSIRSTKHDMLCMLLDEDAEPSAITLPLLTKITNGFSDERVIGRGGFAVVYKGVLGDHMAVAVKKLTKVYMHQEEFLQEVECLMKVRHKNIVRFLGYCVESQGNVQSYNGKIVIAEDLKKILCFEYLPKGTLSDYIKDESGGLDWRTRYQIIKGMCEALQYLHEINIVHLDLKPDNVLLDEKMIPKIADFGISRCFKDGQTPLDTKVVGTLGYLAPELYSGGTITKKSDLYSLGVMITEIITGKRWHEDVSKVLTSWSNRCHTSQFEQIRVCTEIGLECSNLNPGKRPECMNHIIDRLTETESSQVISPVAAEGVLLCVRPSVLCFPITKSPSKMRCLLDLTNTTDEYVNFSLKKLGYGSYYGDIFPSYGVVPPRTNYSVILETYFARCVLLEDIEIQYLVLNSTTNSMNHKLPLKVFSTRSQETIMSLSKGMSPGIKVLNFYGYHHNLTSLDTIKQWTIVGEYEGQAHIWDNRTQERVHSMKVSRERVTCVKFIARKELLVVGTSNGYMHVYNCETTVKKITSFRATDNYLQSLAVHPTQPYLLSSDRFCMKLWHWDKGFECIINFEKEHSEEICQVAFNLNGTIASASMDSLVKVWSVDSPKSNCTLYGHSSTVNSLAFFTCDDKEYLATGSDDYTAKIWDLRTKICIHTLEASNRSPVICVVYEPNFQILITGSQNGLIYYWNTLNSYRLERIIKTRAAGMSLACSTGRVVIGTWVPIIADIDNVNNYNEPKLTGDATCKVTLAASSLDLQPLEICFPCEDGPCSHLHLTNKTDEHVIFSLRQEKQPSCLLSYGVAPPKSTCTLIILRDYPSWFWNQKQNNFCELVLRSSIWGHSCLFPFNGESELNQIFEEAKYFGPNTVHEVSMKEGDTTSAEPVISPRVKVMFCYRATFYEQKFFGSIDSHPIEPWFIVGQCNGALERWDYYGPSIPTDTTDHLNYKPEGFHIGASTSMENHASTSMENPSNGRYMRKEPVVKIIARNQWILAGWYDGVVRVYNSELHAITTFRAPDDYRIYDMGIHPTEPYVVLSMEKHTPLFELLALEMEVWGWDEGGQCTQISAGDDGDMLNPNSFMGAAHHGIQQEKVSWDERVNCLHYFMRGDRQYLITAVSADCTAKIWDLEEKACIHTMGEEAIMCRVTCVASLLPHRPYLLTGSEHGTVQVWSSTDFRLKRTVSFYHRDGPILGLACLMGSRVVVAQENAISIMEIDQEVEALASEVNNENSVCPSG